MNQENNNFNNMFGLTNNPQSSPNEINNLNAGQINQQVQPANPVVNEFNQQPNFNSQSTQNYQQPMYQQPINNGNKKNKVLLPIIIGAVVVVGLILFFVLGGKSKTLVCTNSQTSYGIEIDMVSTMEFKNNKVKSLDALLTVDLGSYKSQKDLFIEQFEKQYKPYAEKGIKLDITSDDSKIYISLKADRSNYDVVNFFTSESYANAKKELENSGFTCK